METAETAQRFGVGLTSIMRWVKNPEIKNKRNKPAHVIDMEALKQDLKLYPDAYLKERAERFNVTYNGICLFIHQTLTQLRKNGRKLKHSEDV